MMLRIEDCNLQVKRSRRACTQWDWRGRLAGAWR